MNSFAFRHIRDGLLYQAQYRLAHWSGFRTVNGENGQPRVFAHPMDAERFAAHELVKALNGNSSFWSGPTGNEAKAAAELLFKPRDDDGQEKSSRESESHPIG